MKQQQSTVEEMRVIVEELEALESMHPTNMTDEECKEMRTLYDITQDFTEADWMRI